MNKYEVKLEDQTLSHKFKRESKKLFLLFKHYNLIFIGKLSNASTFCSFVTKESEETKASNTYTRLINLNFERASNSAPKLFSSKIYLIPTDIKLYSFKSIDSKKVKCQKKVLKSKEKLTLINIKGTDVNNTTCVNKTNFIPTPATLNESRKKPKNLNSKNDTKTLKSQVVNKEKNLNCDIYTQSFNLSKMKKTPPKLPEVLNFEHSMKNKFNESKSNETYGQLYQGSIPNIFFGHIMTECYLGKNKYLKSSVTQRNKSKLLTILYYKPSK